MIDIPALREMLLPLAFTTTRMLACFNVAPFMGAAFITGVVRNGLAISFSLVLFPVVAASMPAEFESPSHIALLLAKEVLIGFLLGFIAGGPFWVAQAVGFFADNQRGTSMASVFDPFAGEQTSPLGSMLMHLAITIFYASGSMLFFLGIIYQSYLLMPIFEFLPPLDKQLPVFALAFADHLMRLIFMLAAPMIIGMFLVDFCLGLVNRFAPSLNVFFLSMPVKSALGIFILILYLSFFFRLLQEEIVGQRYLLKLLEIIVN